MARGKILVGTEISEYDGGKMEIYHLMIDKKFLLSQFLCYPKVEDISKTLRTEINNRKNIGKIIGISKLEEECLNALRKGLKNKELKEIK